MQVSQCPFTPLRLVHSIAQQAPSTLSVLTRPVAGGRTGGRLFIWVPEWPSRELVLLNSLTQPRPTLLPDRAT